MKHERGFTLIEIMIAIAIVALITGVVGHSLYDSFEDAKVSVAEIQVQAIDEAVELHKLTKRRYPAQLAEIAFQGDKPVPRDPWQRDYDYVAPGSHNPKRFDVSSPGPDETSGSADDIGNWDQTPPARRTK